MKGLKGLENVPFELGSERVNECLQRSFLAPSLENALRGPNLTD